MCYKEMRKENFFIKPVFVFISRIGTRTGMWIRVVETEVDLRRPWMRRRGGRRQEEDNEEDMERTASRRKQRII